MNKILTIAKYALIENVSNKIFNGVIFFGGLILFVTSLLNKLSLNEGKQVTLDTGIFTIEIFVMLLTVYISSTQILKAQKDKSIYLILTKAVTKNQYIFGSVLGIIYTVATNIFGMGILLGIIINEFTVFYLLSLLFIFLKLSILVSIGVFFSIMSESFITSIIFTISTYFTSHALIELKTMTISIEGTMYEKLIDILYIILPKYHLLNYRDYLTSFDADIIMLVSYSLIYIMVLTLISSLIFNKKRL